MILKNRSSGLRAMDELSLNASGLPFFVIDDPATRMLHEDGTWRVVGPSGRDVGSVVALRQASVWWAWCPYAVSSSQSGCRR